MYILGINISHDSSSCLIKDGEIIFYREDERISKLKHNSISNDRTPNPFLYYHIDNIKKHTKVIDYIIFSSPGIYDSDMYLIESVLTQLTNKDIEFEKILYHESFHHIYHAYNAAFCSGFKECACLIIDGMGAPFRKKDLEYREIESIYEFNFSIGIKEKFKHYSRAGSGHYDEFEIVKKSDYDVIFSNSLGCGVLFNQFSTSLGYNSGNDAGKIMGLSSYGTYIKEYGRWFSYPDNVGITNNNLLRALVDTISFKSNKEQQDILKTLQEETKLHTIHLIKKALEICNTNNIVLSGGYFLNCVNNYKYLKEFPEVNFYVDPVSHDGGTAIGAVKYLWWNLTKDQTIRKLDSLYLG